jgi:hypothetical protein
MELRMRDGMLQLQSRARLGGEGSFSPPVKDPGFHSRFFPQTRNKQFRPGAEKLCDEQNPR